MLSRGLQSRHGTLGGTHAFRNRVLGEPCPGARLQELADHLVLELQRRIGFREAFTLACLRQERTMIVSLLPWFASEAA